MEVKCSFNQFHQFSGSGMGKKREKHLPVKLDLGNVDYSWKKSYGSEFPQ